MMNSSLRGVSLRAKKFVWARGTQRKGRFSHSLSFTGCLLPSIAHSQIPGAFVGRQAVGGSEVEAAAGVCCCLRGQRRAAEQAPYTHRGQQCLQQGFHLCLSQQKERQEKEGKFSPKQQQAEGRPLYELGIASGEHASSLDPRVQTCCVTQPARGGGEEAAHGGGSSSGCPREHLRGLEGLSPGSTAWLRWILVKHGHSHTHSPSTSADRCPGITTPKPAPFFRDKI